MKNDNKRKKFIDEILGEFIDNTQVIGIFQGGSSLYQKMDENTDFDIFVVTEDDFPGRLHGYRKSDVLVEYFTNPISRLYKQMEQEINEIHDYWVIKIYAFGKILYDKDGNARKLQMRALEYFAKSFGSNDDQRQYKMYIDILENYMEYKSQQKYGLSSLPMYYETMRAMVTYICYRDKTPLIPWNKCERILIDSVYREQYHLKALPEKEVCELLKAGFKAVTEQERNYILESILARINDKNEYELEGYCEYK